ncbi:MAG TPA: hypothetical protein VN737_08260 [Bryobacteraceae bacterium]|nr:hypothetical protein [Bryobacteraceae bacterium]
MRRPVSLGTAVVVVFLFLSSCGYIGPVLPPSLHIPVAIKNLTVQEVGTKLTYQFTLPGETSDGVFIRRFDSIDLRIGPDVKPFDLDTWAAGATRQQIPLPEPRKKKKGDSEEPDQQIASSIAASSLAGKRVVVAVRTAVRGERFSQWSNIVRIKVVEPLLPPVVKPDSDPKGVRLTWPAQRSGLKYRVLRQGPKESRAVEVAVVDKPEFVDAGAAYGTLYHYTVIALDTDDDANAQSEPSEAVSITPEDKFAPSVPSGLTALATPNSIELSWSRSPEPDTKGYAIYRSVDGGPFQRVAGLLALPTYSDKDVQQGKKYRYEVSAIDEHNNKSDRSAAVEVTF